MITPFLIGFLGSLHCIGMCGPITLTLLGHHSFSMRLISYHLARVLTYVIIGAFLGTFGYSLFFFHIQQYVAIVIGSLILIVYLVPRLRKYLERFYYQTFIYRWINRQVFQKISIKNKWILGGIMNGLLPCGLTYIAMAGAAVSANYVEGALYMWSFGLGTVPAMLLVSLGETWTMHKFRWLIPKVIPIIAILSGILLILRGVMTAIPNFNQLINETLIRIKTTCGF